MISNKLFAVLLSLVIHQYSFPQDAFAYLDPGTGSYIFQLLIATFIGGIFTIKMYWRKIKNYFGNIISRKKGK